MKMRVFFTIALVALLAVPGALFAQSAPATAKPAAISVTIVYHENNSGTFTVRDDKGADLGEPTDGDELKVGYTIVTGKGDVAELKLNHTSTIIKVSGNTNFTLKQLRSESAGQDLFALTVGKVRTVAGKASTKDQYQIQTQSAVCGVRGSDIVVESADGTTTKVSTLEGTGWMAPIPAQGSDADEGSIYRLAADSTSAGFDIPQGFEIDDALKNFTPVQIPADVLKALTDEMKFTKLDVNEALQAAKAYQASLAQPAQPSQPAQNQTTPPKPQTNSTMDNILTMLRDILGFEIGSINVPDQNGNMQTYAKAVFQPTFSLGKLKMSLYLPIIYQDDMFNTSDWYRPAGNDEWSFGRDQVGLGNQIIDATRDVLLKIRYVEYGRQRDPFFLKVGNLDDITIGHGLVMQNFSNDADFPAVRHVGLNFGVDGAGGGFEFMANDLAPQIVGGDIEPPDIMGTRLYIRPIPGFRAALGISTIVDLDPARDFPGGPGAAGNPIFITPGVDLDLPFVESDFFGLVMFADGAVLLPYLQSAPTAFPGLNAGFQTKAFLDSSAKMPLKNWGTAAGIFGNLIIPDFTYRLQYQLYTGNFVPQMYDASYERTRAQIVYNTLSYLTNNPAAEDAWNMGVYGEGGFALGKLFSLNLGYEWPWTYNNGVITADADNDHFIASFTIQKGVIPVVNVWGTVSYERTGFVGTIQNHGLSGALFDANTVVSATINYPVSPIMDVTLLYTVVAARDANGNLIYNGSLIPETDTSLSIETQIHL